MMKKIVILFILCTLFVSCEKVNNSGISNFPVDSSSDAVSDVNNASSSQAGSFVEASTHSSSFSRQASSSSTESSPAIVSSNSLSAASLRNSSASSSSFELSERLAFRDSYILRDKYIVFFLTNTTIYQAVSFNIGKDADKKTNFITELPMLFDQIDSDSQYKYAFGLSGPMLLTQSIQEMRDEINLAFNAAEKYNVPVYFQLDDCNNYTTQFGNGATPKFYQNPDWCEWVSFPKFGERWGGQSNGRLPYYWFNWGSYMHAEAFPSFQSDGLRKFVVNQLQKGVLEPLNERYDKLRKVGREYLFAGMSIGWETHIPDYSISNTILHVSPYSLPVNILKNDRMEAWEASKYGYNSLNMLNKSTYDIEALYKVIHDYSELLAKTAYDSGIPKQKIFTHMVGFMSANPGLRTTFSPPVWAAVNNYSIPGFTLSPVTCPYNIAALISEINKADSDQQNFVCAEGYARGLSESFSKADQYFSSMFDNGAALVTVFGWGIESESSMFAVSHSPANPFVMAAKKWLNS